MDPGEVLALLLVVLGVTVVLRPIAVAVAKRIGGEHHQVASGEQHEEILEELQEMRRGLAELGERMDFAERLLARQQDNAPRIGPRGE